MRVLSPEDENVLIRGGLDDPPAAEMMRRAQKARIRRLSRIVATIEITIDQIRQPGMKRTWVRSPDRFQKTNT